MVVVERLLLFLFCCLLRLLRLLGHVPLRSPKAQCKSKSRLHQNCKIDAARFKEGKQRRDTRPGEGFAPCVDTARLVGSEGKKFSRGRKTKPAQLLGCTLHFSVRSGSRADVQPYPALGSALPVKADIRDRPAPGQLCHRQQTSPSPTGMSATGQQR